MLLFAALAATFALPPVLEFFLRVFRGDPPDANPLLQILLLLLLLVLACTAMLAYLERHSGHK
jgi:hypothetical protein